MGSWAQETFKFMENGGISRFDMFNTFVVIQICGRESLKHAVQNVSTKYIIKNQFQTKKNNTVYHFNNIATVLLAIFS